MVSSSVIVADDNGEVASNTNQDDNLSRGDASVVVTADNQNVSQGVSDETSLHIPDNCIVENTPPQNRKLKKHVVLGVWRDVKRLKGVRDLRHTYMYMYLIVPVVYCVSNSTTFRLTRFHVIKTTRIINEILKNPFGTCFYARYQYAIANFDMLS